MSDTEVEQGIEFNIVTDRTQIYPSGKVYTWRGHIYQTRDQAWWERREYIMEVLSA